MPLNDANFHLKVNMLKYKGTNKKGEIKRFSWITNLPLDRDTVTLIMRAGRRRWAIENEFFKTLKDRDVYNVEHNYGNYMRKCASGGQSLANAERRVEMCGFVGKIDTEFFITNVHLYRIIGNPGPNILVAHFRM